MSGIDLPLTSAGDDIDFGRDTVTGLPEYRDAALLRITNDVTYDDLDYGLDVTGELGKLTDIGYEQSLGLRCCAAIQNDTRFVSATVTNSTRTTVDETLYVSLSFEVEVVDGTTFSLSVLVANGEVRLV